MSIFRRKKTTVEQVEEVKIPTPCEMFGHIWQDFPWIIEDEYNSSNKTASYIRIKEHYMCRVCHKIETKILFSEYESLSRKAHDEKIEQLEKKYKDHIQPVPVVMDMIHDMKLVDREKLKYWEKLHAPKEEDEQEEENDIGQIGMPALRCE